MLANHQFIEQRVYDEEVPQGDKPLDAAQPPATVPPPAEEMTKEQREALLIPKYTQAFQTGVKIIELVAAMNPQPAANGDAGAAPAAPAHAGPYSKRPLPFIVGTKEFFE